jgi:hypothetical protein
VANKNKIFKYEWRGDNIGFAVFYEEDRYFWVALDSETKKISSGFQDVSGFQESKQVEIREFFEAIFGNL